MILNANGQEECQKYLAEREVERTGCVSLNTKIYQGERDMGSGRDTGEGERDEGRG